MNIKEANFPAGGERFNALPHMKTTIGERNVRVWLSANKGEGRREYIRQKTGLAPFAWLLPEDGRGRENHVQNLLQAMTALDDITPVKGFLLRVGFWTSGRGTWLVSYPHVSIHQVYEAEKIVQSLTHIYGYEDAASW